MPRVERISVMIMGVVCFLFMQCSLGYAVDHEAAREELRGIEKVYLSIQCTTPKTETNVLTEQQIRSDIRNALRVTALRVIPGKRYGRGKLFPAIGILNVACKVFTMQEGGYGYDIVIEIFRRIEIESETSEIPLESVPVWSVKKFDIADEMIDIRNEIKKLTGIFVRAYSSVNPRRADPFNRRGRSMRTF